MGIQWVRDNYRVPAKRGGRVEYTGNKAKGTQLGTITRADGPHLRIRLDGEKYAGAYHPTWCIEYLDAALSQQAPE